MPRDSLSVADVLVQSVCSGHVDSSFSHSLMNEPVQSEELFAATQPSEAGKNRRESTTEGSAHDCTLPFSQIPSTPSTPMPKLGISPVGAHPVTTHSADTPLNTDLLSLLAPDSHGQMNIGSEANTGSIDSEASSGLDNLFQLLCEHQDDEAETLLMSQAFWDAEEHLE